MKFCRFGPKGQEKPGIVDADGKIRDLSGVISDLTPDTVRLSQLKKLTALDVAALPVVPDAPRSGYGQAASMAAMAAVTPASE